MSDDDVFYHGSREPREELRGNNPGYAGSLGYGLYLTTDPEFARTFGPYIHEVVSPVPPSLVAGIEPYTYECGNSMQLYTPGSVPFTFSIDDMRTRKRHLYSVLGDCEEEVKSSLRSGLRKQYQPSARLRASVASAPPKVTKVCESLWASAGKSVADDRSRLFGRSMSDAVEDLLDGFYYEDEGLSEREFKRVSSIVTRTAKEMDAYADKKMSETLGDEIDMDSLSSIAERHGYSAFFISGYAPGDEYVIFDDKYLPLTVRRVEKVRP